MVKMKFLKEGNGKVIIENQIEKLYIPEMILGKM